MGYNTVVMILNDAMHTLEKSPKTLTRLLTTPMGPGTPLDAHIQYAIEAERQSGELGSGFYGGAIKVLPTFHADEFQFLLAGHNSIIALPFVKYGHTKDGKLTVMLIAPDYLNPKAATREKAKAKRKPSKKARAK